MGRALRLLVVEDNADAAELLAELLENHGHSVRVAGTASAALELAQRETFDVVVSDVGLPDASGYELMEQLRARSPIKGIAITGTSGVDEERRGREAGFSAHLVKPVSMSRLEEALEAVVS
jgi:CheY-like chemotaxis protein